MNGWPACCAWTGGWPTPFDDPRQVLGDPRAAAEQAAAFRRWDADPTNRVTTEHRRTTAVEPRLINDDLRAVAELFAFMAANPAEQITRLKKQHRQETQALRAALEQTHGENLDLRRELARHGWSGQPSPRADHADPAASTISDS